MKWFEELVFDKDPLSMGLSKTSWHLTPMEDPSRKKEILSDHRDDALACLPGLESVLGPLEALAMIVEEDICLLLPIGDEYVLVAGCVCAPSRWSLQHKLGKGLGEIHSLVPHYSQDLNDRINFFLRRYKPDQVMARRNWSIHEEPDLYAPTVPDLQNFDVSGQYLRSERQTIYKLKGSNAIVFSILIEQTEMENLTPELRETMALHLMNEPVDVSEYHGRPAMRQAQIIDWLTNA